MGDLVLKGGTSGQITVTPTAVAGTNTLTLPANTGTVVTTGSSSVVTQTMLGANVAGNGPAFLAYLSADQTVTSSSYTKVNLNTTSYNQGSGFNTSTYGFTPPINGYYLISALLNAGNSTGNLTRNFVNIYNGATQVSRGSDVGNSGGTSVIPYTSVTTVPLYLTTSDTVYMYAFITASTSAIATGGQVNCWMSGVLLRAA
jgi:hypothetical protein